MGLSREPCRRFWNLVVGAFELYLLVVGKGERDEMRNEKDKCEV